MNVACSSATFAIQNAIDTVVAGHARACWWSIRKSPPAISISATRETHFIFGDASVSIIVENAEDRARGLLGHPRLEAADALFQ